MKKKNLLILLISIIVPLAITTFFGAYSFGALGNRENLKEKFINSIFNENAETKTSIENYAKFAGTHYLNLSQNMTVYSNYEEKTVLNPTDGSYTIENKLTVTPYAIASVGKEGQDSNISYMFFLSSINYNNVSPSNVYFISVQGTSDESYEHLGKAIEQFNSYWVDGVDGTPTTGGATVPAARKAPTPIYDIHAVLKDSDSDVTPFVYSLTPTRNYQVADEDGMEDSQIQFKNLTNCSWAIIETTTSKETTVLMTGLLEDIKRSGEALANLNNVNLGYGTLTGEENKNGETILPLNTLMNAGYFKFALPTLALVCGISLVITGFLSLLFYFTWTYNDENPKQKLKKSKK